MDDPDFAILCAIQESPLDGPAAWARRAGLDQTTLRRRMKRLEEKGALQGFVATPAAAAFRRIARTLEFQPESPTLADILAVDDVAWAAIAYDGRTWVHVYEGQDRAQELEAMLGPHVTASTVAHEPAATILGRIEMKVLKALIEAPRATVADLVEMTGLSAKTVRNHRATLIAQHFIRIDPVLRPPRTPSRLYYHFTVQADRAADARAAIGALPEAVAISEYNDGRDVYAFAAADGLEEQAGQVEAVRSVEGVREVTLIVTREFSLATARLIGWCDEAIQAWR